MTVETDSETYGIPPDVYHRRQLILAVLCLSLVIVVVAVSSLNVAIPTLQRELDASPTELQWIIDAYALVFAGFLLPAGALGDRFGRKGALQIGLVIFGVCSALSSQAGSPEELIAYRAVAGLGAALIMPATLSIITNSFPPHERGKAIATWAGLAGAGGAIGPILSGLMLEHFWWGSIFFVNIPLIALLLVLTWLIVPTSKDPAGHALDPIGALMSVIGLVALVFGIIEGPEWGWASPGVIAAFAVAVVFLVGFVLWELHTPTPTLDPRLFRLPGFGMGSLAITMSFFCMFGMFFLITQYLQFVEGDSPLMAGFKTLPAAVMLVLVSPRSPLIVGHLGVRKTTRLGFGLITLGFFGFANLAVGTAYWYFALSIMCLASGLALVMPPSTTAIISSLPLAKAGVGSAVNDVTREVGGAIGIAVLGSIVNSLFGSHLELDRVEAMVPPPGQGRFAAARPALEEGIGPAFGVAGEIARGAPFPGAAQLAEAIRETARFAFVDAMSVAFYVAAGVAVVAALVVTTRIPDQTAMGEAHGATTTTVS